MSKLNKMSVNLGSKLQNLTKYDKQKNVAFYKVILNLKICSSNFVCMYTVQYQQKSDRLPACLKTFENKFNQIKK